MADLASIKAKSRKAYTVGWICAISPELDAARAILDEEHPPPQDLALAWGDTNNYLFGRIGKHNVVIARLPEGQYGTNRAATTATHMIRSFQVKFGLMVGVGGGVPIFTDDPTTTKDIRLGDIVVSTPDGKNPGVIQYDMGKATEGKDRLVRTGVLNKPPTILLSAVGQLKSKLKFFQHILPTILDSVDKKYPNLKTEFAHPGAQNDILMEAQSGFAEPKEVIDRPQRTSTAPVVFYGTIASGNQVVKDTVTRDYWRDTNSVLCFEMEAAGLMDDFKCLVIRGICDYCDSEKNKRWQPYAALTAAAYAKALLNMIEPDKVQHMKPMESDESDESMVSTCDQKPSRVAQ